MEVKRCTSVKPGDHLHDVHRYQHVYISTSKLWWFLKGLFPCHYIFIYILVFIFSNRFFVFDMLHSFFMSFFIKLYGLLLWPLILFLFPNSVPSFFFLFFTNNGFYFYVCVHVCFQCYMCVHIGIVVHGYGCVYVYVRVYRHAFNILCIYYSFLPLLSTYLHIYKYTVRSGHIGTLTQF